ncbi:MAG: signal peptidase I [Haloferacaceae archaeon]
MFRRGLLLVVLAFALLAIAPASSPVELSYVYSDSMEPAIDEGDGYLLVPAGDVERGDVVTFYSPRRGTYVTHRVVRETERGFVTKGDANPSTDQAGGAPPVERERITGQVLTVGGEPLVLPHLGTAIEFVRHNQVPVFAVAALVTLGRHAAARGSTSRRRDVLRFDDVVPPALVGLAAVSVVFVVVGASHAAVVYPVEETATDDPTVLTAGDPAVRTHRVAVASPRFAQVLVDVDGMTVVDRDVRRTDRLLIRRTTLNVTTRVTPRTAGTYRGEISVYAYPPLLPRGVLASLHAVHPVVGAVVSSLALYGPLGAAYLLLVDGTVPVRIPPIRALRRLLDG